MKLYAIEDKFFEEGKLSVTEPTQRPKTKKRFCQFCQFSILRGVN